MSDPRDTSQGYLQVSVSTAQDAIPIEGAVVTVAEKTPDNAPPVLLYTARTDRSGKTPVLPLAAPPKSSSLQPNGDRPYAVYTVQVDHPEYQPVAASNLTIFADVVADLPVYLVPLMETQTLPQPPNARVLPPHSLSTQEVN